MGGASGGSPRHTDVRLPRAGWGSGPSTPPGSARTWARPHTECGPWTPPADSSPRPFPKQWGPTPGPPPGLRPRTPLLKRRRNAGGAEITPPGPNARRAGAPRHRGADAGETGGGGAGGVLDAYV
ncbi:hypothetical protein GCM10010390_00550 [Streptomyces mordarskii]|uniref:Uncharacterized protein n=1 Tax=Streptomyces mordarskii TaxID=1226758 RepID=A0ABN1BPE5_9ACTN